MGVRGWNLEFGVWDLEFGIWNLIPHNWGGVLKIYKIENPSAL